MIKQGMVLPGIIPVNLCVCLFLMLYPFHVAAQKYYFRNYNVEDGLAQSQVLSINQDINGYLWFGSFDGLSRYDGYTFTTFSRKDGLASNSITTSFQDEDGKIWFGHPGGKITIYDPITEQFTILTLSELPTRSDIRKIYKDSRGIFWIASQARKVFTIKNGLISEFNSEDHILDTNVLDIVETPKGEIWFSTRKGIVVYDPVRNSFSLMTTKDGLWTDYVGVLFRDSRGNIWIGYNIGRISVYHANPLHPRFGEYDHMELPDVKDNFVNVIYEDRNQTLWLGSTTSGVLKYLPPTPEHPQPSFEIISEKNGLSKNRVLSILQDREGNLWFGTSGGGVCQFRGKRFEIYGVEEGLIDPIVWSIMQDHQGNYWIATDMGVTFFPLKNDKLDLENYKSISVQDGIPGYHVITMLEDQKGRIWFGTARSGIGIYDPGTGTFEYMNMKNGLLPVNAVFHLKQDQNGRIWMATFGAGALRYDVDTGETLQLTTKEGLSSNFINSVYIDSRGEVWFATDGGGVCKFDGDSITHYTQKDGLTAETIMSITEDANGNMWFGSSGHGLFSFDGKKFLNLTDQDGLSGNLIYSILADGNTLWIGNTRGIDRLNLKDTTFYHYGKLDGVLGLENNQNAIYKDRYGNIWFGTIAGAIKYNPREDRPNLIPPTLRITSVKYFLYDEPVPASAKIPYSKNDIKIYYTALSLSVPEKILYKYKLEGFSEEWSPPTTERSAAFSNLPPGEYVFKVIACNNNGIWSEDAAQYVFTIQSPFWQKAWFILLVIGTLTAGAFGLHRQRVRRIERENLILEERVRTRTQELLEEKEKVEKAYQALQESEEKFRALAETTPSAIFIYQQSQFRYVNPATCQITGYSQDEIMKLKFWEIVHEDYKEIVRRRGLLRQTGTPVPNRYEFKIVTKDGKVKWIDFTARPIIYKNQPAALGTAFDITDRKITEENLMRTEKRLRNVLSNVDAYLWSARINGKGTIEYNFYTDNVVKVTGYSKQEFLDGGYPFWMNLVHPEDRRRVEQNLAELLQGGSVSEEYRIICKDGDVRWIYDVATPTLDDQGNIKEINGICVDITDRKITEEALRESEENLRTLIHHIPDMIVFKDGNGRWLEANKTALELFELTDVDYKGKTDLELAEIRPFFKDALEFCVTSDEKAWRDRTLTRGEEVVTRRNGEARIFDTIKVPLFTPEGQRKGLLVIGRDITENKLAEKRLRDSEKSYRDLFNSIPDAIYVQDKEGRFLDVNQGAVHMYGYSKEEFLGRTPAFLAYHDKVDMKKTFHHLKKAFAGEPQKFEWWGLRKNGEVFPKEVALTRSQYFGQEVVIAIARDITERKQAQELLEAQKERLSVTLRSIGEGVISTNQKGTITLINRVAENLLGYHQEEVLGKPLDAVFHIYEWKTRKLIRSPLREILKSGIIWESNSPILLKSRTGQERIIQVSFAPIRDKSSNNIGAVLVFRDITEQQKLEEELARTQKLESLGILAGGIAHDFNNILTSILGNISLAKIFADPSDKIYERLSIAEKATLRAQDLTQQLLTFAKGGTPIKKTASIIDIIKESTEFALRGSNVKYEFNYKEPIWSVEVDEGQISQVIQNLIINADQAMPSGGTIYIGVENVRISANNGGVPLKPGLYIKVTIRDEGIGIPPEYLEKIFDPFFTTKQKGSGLGLSSAYSIIKKHDGHIMVQSSVGEGTVFTIFLPATKRSPETPRKQSTAAVQGQGKILIMDDEDYILDILAQILSQLGYQAIPARTGEEAIEIYNNHLSRGQRFDAVIMDLTVPGGMGGVETISRLREIDPEVVAIVSSGYSNDPVMANFRDYGFMGVMKKPYRIEEVSEILHHVLSQV